MSDPFTAAILLPPALIFVQVMVQYRMMRKQRREQKERESREKIQLQWKEEIKDMRMRAEKERDMVAQREKEKKAEQMEKEKRGHFESQLERDKEWKRMIEEQQREWDRMKQEQQEREKQAREDREWEAQLLREQMERERNENAQRRATESEYLKRVVQQIIHLFIYMFQQQSRARPGRIQYEGYPYSDGSQVYRQLLTALDLPEGIDDVNSHVLSMFNQSLHSFPMLQYNSNNVLNTAGSSRGNELALLELPEQLPEGFEDELLVSVMREMNTDNPAASLDAGNSIVHLNQRYGCLKISTPINDGTEAKEQGNAYFKDQNYNEAIKCYSKSINLSPTAAAYGNRAMAYIKLNEFIQAEKDCTEALRIDPSYFKAYARRAMARSELGGNLKGALEDVEVALKTDPTNIDMRQLRAELREMLGYHGNGPTGSLAIEH